MEVSLQEGMLARRLSGIGFHSMRTLVPENSRVDSVHSGVPAIVESVGYGANPVIVDGLVRVNLERG